MAIIAKRGPMLTEPIVKRCFVWCGRTAEEGCECSSGDDLSLGSLLACIHDADRGGPADMPEGFALLPREVEVEKGDLWCHQGKVLRHWLPATPGPQLSYNDYCRKIAA